MKSTLLTALVLVAAALAGCAQDAADPAPGTDAPTTTTPTPVTPTPPEGGADGNSTGETPDNSTGEAPSFKDCPAPPSTNATPGTRMGYPELVFTVQEPQDEDDCFAFVGPATATAGWTAITLQNNGMMPHIMPMFRLAEGKTLEDVEAALAKGEEPTWAVPVGGVGFVTPFANATVLVDLEPGTYVLACFFAGHHTQGMYRALNVTEAPDNATSAPAPEADLTFEMMDFGYKVPENLTAGSYVVKFVNNGTQPHEAPLVALQGNATMQEFLAAVENPAGGPPPGAGAGGVNVLAPGATAYALVDFREGDYGFVCFVEDPERHMPHVALGMVTQFHVSAAA